MLSRLSIRDIVLIDRLDIDFADGLAVLTGETGAGKSILLDAFALALGARGDQALVRQGVEQGQVIAAFEVARNHPARKLLKANDIVADDELILRRVQFAAIMAGGVLGGISGGTLVLAQVGTFAEGMSAGRGFIAIAIVALGRWNPIGAAAAAVIFGAASALQFLFQAMGWHAPYQLFLAFPYVLTLAALAFAGSARHGGAPAALGRARIE